jgi:hypothetical protein
MASFRRILIVVLVAVPAVATPCAQARALRAPKWLLPPYRQYVLTYDGSESSQGSEVTTMPNSMYGGLCDFPMTTYQDAQSIHYHTAYQFLFGRSRDTVTHRLQFAFIYARRKLSGPGQHTYSSNTTPPPGCPPPDPRDTRFGSSTCTSHYRLDSAAATDQLSIGAPRRKHGAFVFAVAVDPATNADEPNCSGNDPGPPPFPARIPGVVPSTGSLSFSDRSVRARRTFNGTVAFAPAGARSGSGTDPENDPTPQDAWSFNTSQHGTFRLAPGTTAH